MRIIEPGLLTSIQDIGRFGYQRYGVIVSGAMDSFALRAANLLVGNEEHEAVLEITLKGPTIEMEEDVWLAICGASLSPKLDGQDVAEWRPFFAREGSVLRFGKLRAGCRAYLAVAGGFDIPLVLGSRSTYLRAQLGGMSGRALKRGDVLNLRNPAVNVPDLFGSLNEASIEASQASFSMQWFASRALFPAYQLKPVVRVLAGREFDLFTKDSVDRFFSEEFQLTPNSDRMGYRLKGPSLELSQPVNLISEAVTAGTIQVPADGNPIILMADRQTTGGYPRIADVITVDLPVLAQLKPGDKLCFQMVTIDEAQKLIRMKVRDLQLLKQAVLLQRRGG